MEHMQEISKYISFLLRHHPEKLNLHMNMHGWVEVGQLLDGINQEKKYALTMEDLEEIVETDSKGRYRFNEGKSKIKACQGHSIPWVLPELTFMEPPEVLYHGTTEKAWKKIQNSGYILKMKRHAVHMQAQTEPAWQSAKRWNLVPVVLVIDSRAMHADHYEFGKTENEVWCTEAVPVKYVKDVLYEKES